MEKENKELKEIIEKLQHENFELRKKQQEIKQYISSHIRTMMNELKYEILTEKNFYTYKKIMFLDSKKITDIIER